MPHQVSRAIAIVIPCYNEASSITPLIDALCEEMSQHSDYTFEVIFVDDGSTDDTVKTIEVQSYKIESARLVCLARNFGKEAAIKAGLSKCDADAVIVMDADLQHPPCVISDLLKHFNDGAAVVVAKRINRDNDGLFRRLATNIFYSSLNAISDTPIYNGEGDFRLMSRAVVDTINQMQESNIFMKGVYSFVGFEKRIVEFYVDDTSRASRFSAISLLSLALTAIISNSIIPIRASFIIGVLVVFVAILYTVFEIVRASLGMQGQAGYTTIIILMTLLGGTNLIFLGIVGEYVGRTFIESKNRPQYVIYRTINL